MRVDSVPRMNLRHTCLSQGKLIPVSAAFTQRSTHRRRLNRSYYIATRLYGDRQKPALSTLCPWICSPPRSAHFAMSTLGTSRVVSGAFDVVRPHRDPIPRCGRLQVRANLHRRRLLARLTVLDIAIKTKNRLCHACYLDERRSGSLRATDAYGAQIPSHRFSSGSSTSNHMDNSSSLRDSFYTPSLRRQTTQSWAPLALRPLIPVYALSITH